MNTAIKSRKYAQILLNLADREQVVDEVYQQLGTLDAILRRVGALKAILITTRINPEQKGMLLDRALGKLIHPVLRTFVLQLAIRRELKLFPQIMKKAALLYHDRKNSVRVVATSSVILSPAQIHEITQRVVKAYGKKPEFETVVDPAIIGGLRLRVGNTVIDGSLATRLEQLKKKLSQS